MVDGREIALGGDLQAMAVLNDARLGGFELEVAGRLLSTTRLQLNPSHTWPLRVLRDGRRLLVTYWCDTCSIRSYTPGTCVCCQGETDLALRESLE